MNMVLLLKGKVGRHVAWLSYLCEKVMVQRTFCCLCIICSALYWRADFGFTYNNSYILRIISPLGSGLILDMCYVAAYDALVYHHFIEANCVLTDSDLKKLVLLSYFEEITFLHITTYRMHNFSIFLRSFILTYSKFSCGNEVVICCMDFPIFFKDGYVPVCNES